MKKYVKYIILILVLSSCNTTKDFHRYNVDTSFDIKADYDCVWDEIIDYVSECNFEITNIEKESGLITIKPCQFKACFQIKGYQNKDYYYTVQNCPKYKSYQLFVVSNWNIRVRRINHWVTRVNVNLIENGKVIATNNKEGVSLNLYNNTTGTFEKNIKYEILDRLRKNSFMYEDNYINYNGESN